ncbi:DUF4255 domain-containing protein [Streptacidiphilus sp. PB12-B1b]|uniref:Pvc16 family protein n=1 Tax=Streptacidiphilus sp. PB12-B1b TaxID=2705012 RepID=UPI0015FB96E8|nr:Pvc16 family protein [Streptacidiphilus sp. PB12-B1b]QMU78016.1 DUF4255 domain-containing protein [Streptacidiphilus sp. PB12-B1b]
MSMLRDADLSLANWLGSVLPPGTGVRFDAPCAAWQEQAAGAPFVSLFLGDIRRDGQEQPASGWSEVRDTEGRLLGTQPAARHYRVSYTVTAWADPAAAPDRSRQTMEEHGLLGLLIDACSTADTLADDHLTGALAEAGLPSFVRCGGDEPGRSAAGLWSGFGITPRAHLVLELVAPVVPPLVTDLASPARELVLGASRVPAGPAATPAAAAAGTATGSAAEAVGTGAGVRRWERRTLTESASRPRAGQAPPQG